MGWFIIASIVSLSIGLVMANLLHPGSGLNLPMPTATETGLKTEAINFRDFITHVFPTSVVQAMAGNEVLQIRKTSRGCVAAMLTRTELVPEN